KTREEIRKELNAGGTERMLLSVGSIKPIKGSDFAINCFLKLGKEYFRKNKLKMFFIGDGILRSDLELAVKDNNMDDEIKFLGKRRKEDIGSYLNAADIFIFPSQFEGTPLSLLEAMY